MSVTDDSYQNNIPFIVAEEEKEEEELPSLDTKEIDKMMSQYSQGKVTELQAIRGIITFQMMFHDPRQPEMMARRKMDLQLTNPEAIAKLFKAIGEKEGIKEISDYADNYYNATRVGQVLDYGLGLLQKHGLYDKYAATTKDQIKGARLLIGKGGEELPKEQVSVYADALISKRYRENLPFINSGNLNAQQVVLNSMMSSDETTRERLGDLEMILGRPGDRPAQRNMYDMPVSAQYTQQVKI